MLQDRNPRGVLVESIGEVRYVVAHVRGRDGLQVAQPFCPLCNVFFDSHYGSGLRMKAAPMRRPRSALPSRFSMKMSVQSN